MTIPGFETDHFALRFLAGFVLGIVAFSIHKWYEQHRS